MTTDAIKLIGDYGLGAGALIALVIVVVTQVRQNGRMSDTLQATIENIKENTAVTKELAEIVRGFRDNDRKMVEAVEYCRNQNRNRS